MTFELRNCKALELLQDLETDSVDLVLTDPPYNVNLDYDEYDDDMDDDNYWEWIRQVIKESLRVVKDSGAVCFVTPSNQRREWTEAIDDVGVDEIKGSPVVWCRSNIVGGVPFGNGFDFNTYFIYVLDSGDFQVQTDLPRDADVTSFNYIEEPVPQSNFEGGRVHPAQQPVRVYEKMVLKCSPEEGKVVDPFVSSGSSGVACVRWGRDFVGCDIDEEYLEHAFDRLDSAVEQGRSKQSKLEEVRSSGE